MELETNVNADYVRQYVLYGPGPSLCLLTAPLSVQTGGFGEFGKLDLLLRILCFLLRNGFLIQKCVS